MAYLTLLIHTTGGNWHSIGLDGAYHSNRIIVGGGEHFYTAYSSNVRMLFLSPLLRIPQMFTLQQYVTITAQPPEAYKSTNVI